MSTAKIERAKRGIERLTTLRNVMRRAKSIEGGHVIPVGGGRIVFDIGIWAVNADELYASDEVARMELKPVGVRGESACGTAACVAGTAGLIPEFRALGFRTNVATCGVRYKGGTRDAFEAFSRFFGVSNDESFKVCSPSGYVSDDGHELTSAEITPAHAAEKLTALIAAKRKELRALERAA